MTANPAVINHQSSKSFIDILAIAHPDHVYDKLCIFYGVQNAVSALANAVPLAAGKFA
jgi:hypothetical protein